MPQTRYPAGRLPLHSGALLRLSGEFAFEDLTGRRLRQLVHEGHAARILIGGDPFFGEGDDLLLRSGLTLLHGDYGDDLLAELLMRGTEDGDLGYPFVLVE